MLKRYDIAVVGGGIVGLMFAARLALLTDDLEICVIQDSEPLLDWPLEELPDRVSAINRSSQLLFESLGLWEMILEEGAPYFQMSVWDKASGAEIRFDRREMGCSDLGHIISNRILQKALWEYLSSKPQIHIETGEAPVALKVHPEFVDLQLKEKMIRVRLLVGADGAASWVHKQAGFERYEHDYDHCALIACAQTQKPHQDTAFQSFFSGEILAFLPLKDPNYSSIVWSASPDKIKHLMQLSEEEFCFSLENAIDGRLGEIKRIEEKMAFPLKMRHSKSYVKERIALIGDAIHTIHPLAGQGMNLGLLDAHCLSEFIKEAHEKKRDIGQLSILRRYERFRVGDNWKMITAMSAIKGLFSNDSKWWVPFRKFGMNQVNQLGLIKKYFMEQALGKTDLTIQ